MASGLAMSGRSRRNAGLSLPIDEAVDAVFATARRRRGPYGVASGLAAMLAPCLDELERMIEAGRAAEAEPLLKRIVTSSGPVTERIDDSSGVFHPLCSRATRLWGSAWARIEPRDRKKLAALVQGRVEKSASPISDHMIAGFVAALGPEGLHTLRRRYEAELAAIPPRTAAERGAWSDELSRRLSARSGLVINLRKVADGLGDIDEYIRLCNLDGPANHHGVGIARRLTDAGRHEEALAWIDRAVAADPDRDPWQSHDEPYGAAMVRSLALRRLGRLDEAAAALWEEFRRRPSLGALADIDALAGPDTDAAERRKQAIEVASRHPDVHVALGFLLEANARHEAAHLVTERVAELDGHEYDVLLPLAKRLERTAPAASWRLYRALLESILADGRRKAYGHAGWYLVRMRTLAPVAGLNAEQRAFDAELASTHRLKRAFWEAVEDEGGDPLSKPDP
jgi:tetratricopeptide (TPR) repeat protein